MQITKKFQTDVLVIGAGGSGLRAALAAAEAGSKVILTNKGPIAKSGITLTAAGGIQAPFHPDDSPEQLFQDIINCGYNLADQNLAKALAEDACSRVLDLERYGVRFARNGDGNYVLGQFPGQSRPRGMAIKGGGIGLVSALVKACRQQEKITIIDDFFVSGLINNCSNGEKRITGVIGLNLKNGELTMLQAKAVIMATGGCQYLWEINDCPTDATGEGIIQAYQAGAELVDMEMVLFYPSVIVWPPSLQGAFVHYEFLASNMLDGNVYDKDGNAVLPKPLPVRDKAMKLMADAIRQGRGGPHNGLYWYVGDSPKSADVIQKKLRSLQYKYISAHGVNPAIDKIESAPGAHYLMGGIYIDENCHSSVTGLFATPECAGNFDGANRIAGNGIAATQVFGARAGVTAHQWAIANDLVNADPASIEEEVGKVSKRISSNGCQGNRINDLKNTLRSSVQKYAGVSRDAEGLIRLTGIIKEVHEKLGQEKVPNTKVFNQQLVELLQLESMCEVAALVAGSARQRTESRGHHIRSDFPAQDDVNWLKHTIISRDKKGPVFNTKPVRKV